MNVLIIFFRIEKSKSGEIFEDEFNDGFVDWIGVEYHIYAVNPVENTTITSNIIQILPRVNTLQYSDFHFK